MTYTDAALEALRALSLEGMLASPVGFGLSSASTLQRAVCRIASGKPLGRLWRDASVRRALGDQPPPPSRPAEVAVVAGVRTGKTLLAASAACDAALFADVSRLGPGEVPRFAIVSTSKDTAAVAYRHFVGRVKASQFLRSRLLSDPDSSRDTVLFQHSTGRPVEVCTVAGSRAGSSLVARWLVGCVFDEYARMVGDANEGVVNWSDMRAAVLQRLLPGGYLLHISSPWAPFGPAYDHVQKNWGRPTADLVVVRARADELNPSYWTPERVEDARRRDPEVYRTDVLAEFASPDVALIPTDHIEGCVVRGVESWPRDGACSYIAAIDPATRGNGWTLVVATRIRDKRRIVYAREWRGTKTDPLNPAVVLREVAGVLRGYGIDSATTDQWSGDALAALADSVGLSLYPEAMTDRKKTDRYMALRTMFALGQVELPEHRLLVSDLLRLRKQVTSAGSRVVLPESSDGRHCDFAPAIMQVMSRYVDDVPIEPMAAIEAEVVRMRREVDRTFGVRREEEF